MIYEYVVKIKGKLEAPNEMMLRGMLLSAITIGLNLATTSPQMEIEAKEGISIVHTSPKVKPS